MQALDTDDSRIALAISFPSVVRTEKADDQPAASLRLVDRVLAGAIFAVTLPAMGAIALTIRLLSRRSPFVSHLRVGRNGLPLRMIKFRTMWSKTRPLQHETGWVERIVLPELRETKPRMDPRVTSPFAAWCRAHSMDELPQLWHAMRGEMSLVGPRPLTQIELQRHYGKYSPRVLALAPGMTGLWQVLGRNSLTYPQRLRMDLFLARNYSWALYWWIMFRTIRIVLNGAGAW